MTRKKKKKKEQNKRNEKRKKEKKSALLETGNYSSFSHRTGTRTLCSSPNNHSSHSLQYLFVLVLSRHEIKEDIKEKGTRKERPKGSKIKTKKRKNEREPNNSKKA